MEDDNNLASAQELARRVLENPAERKNIIERFFSERVKAGDEDGAHLAILIRTIIEAANPQEEKKLVITLHGIRTSAPWQKVLADELGTAGFDSKTFDYGFFGALRLILPWKRKAQVKWFSDQYVDKVSNGRVPSIISHSFGTYMIARAMESYGGITFDQVILCGSIVPMDYDWRVLFERGQVKRILNECAERDIAVKASPYFIKDAGPSGAYGFDINDERLCQRFVSKFGHSDYLNLSNFRSSWFPFLRGESPPTSLPALDKKTNWKFWMTIALVLLLLSATIIVVTCRIWPAR
jgi:hypothetical protein